MVHIFFHKGGTIMIRLYLLPRLLTSIILILLGEPYFASIPAQDIMAFSGEVAGRVLDTEGCGVSKTTVFADKSDAPMGKRPYGYTDEQGNFLIKVWAPGTYLIYASKEEDGYPPTHSTFHFVGSIVPPQITVKDEQVTSGVVVRLGPKTARLTGHILDSATNEIIKNAQITLRRVDNPDYMFSTGPGINGQLNILVPSVPFTMKVTAPGYEDWYYRNEDSNQLTDSLHLDAEAVKELVVSLRPDK
jgi:hypothetical protein